MYPQRELTALACRKTVLRFRVFTRRHQCRLAAAEAARPLVWLDGIHAAWRAFSPTVQVTCTTAALAAAWACFRSRARLQAILRWAPAALAVWRELRLQPESIGRTEPGGARPKPPAPMEYCAS